MACYLLVPHAGVGRYPEEPHHFLGTHQLQLPSPILSQQGTKVQLAVFVFLNRCQVVVIELAIYDEDAL